LGNSDSVLHLETTSAAPALLSELIIHPFHSQLK
jgi:hypothetical protein